MTDKATDETTPAAHEAPTKDDELSDQQLEGVAGAAGRVNDCEGYAYLGERVLKNAATGTTAKSE